MNDPITLHRTKGRAWTFRWDESYGAYIYHARKHTYRLFFDSPRGYKPFWIGRLVETDGYHGWVTWEKEINAGYIQFLGSVLVFDEKFCTLGN